IIRGCYSLRKGAKTGKNKLRVQLMGAGTILNEVIAAADILNNDYGVQADIWSVTSINELTRDGQATVRWNMLHPDQDEKIPYITALLSKNTAGDNSGPFV